MRVLAIVSALVAVSAPLPALAAASGPPTGRFATTWTAQPVGSFAPGLPAKIDVAQPRQVAIPTDVVLESVMSANDDTVRRDIAINEMAAGLAPAQRTALEDLRDAQRRWIALADGEPAARESFFLVALRDVAEGRGRSVARDATGDVSLDAAYAGAMRDASDDKLAALQETERTWTAYRDAFARFATAMDHPDAGTAVAADLARRRTEELRAAGEAR